MNYTKPQVAVLGEAAEVIEFISGKPLSQPLDGPKHTVRTNPAYDLDE